MSSTMLQVSQRADERGRWAIPTCPPHMRELIAWRGGSDGRFYLSLSGGWA